jgi:hypothetical protein
MTIVRFPLPLKNGATISVQASETHYCTPRNNEGPWAEFETGHSIREDDPDEGVSGFVTEKEVWDWINARGGLDLSRLLKIIKLVYPKE